MTTDGNRTKEHSPLDALDRKDLALLLRLDHKLLLGRILQFNRGSKYHNHLDAIQLVVCITELRKLENGQSALIE